MPESMAAFQTPAARVKEDGTFQIADVWPDNYRLSFRLPDGMFVRSARVGSEEKLGKALDLTNTEGAVAIEVILSTKVGAVDGIVNANDKPAAGATVTLVPEPATLERAYLLKTVTADQNGRFSFSSVAPGDYRVYAWDDPPRASTRDIEFANPYGSQSVKVAVKENTRETAELTPVKEE